MSEQEETKPAEACITPYAVTEDLQLYQICVSLMRDNVDFASIKIDTDIDPHDKKKYANVSYAKSDRYGLGFPAGEVSGTDEEIREKIITKTKEYKQKYEDFLKSLRSAEEAKSKKEVKSETEEDGA